MSQNSRTPCGLDLEVVGGTFAPDVCQFEIISGGPECSGTEGCRGDYAINLKNSMAGPDEIASVVLFNISAFRTGTYRFDPGTASEDFTGQLIDKGAVARRLLRGEITLDRRADDTVHVLCDVHFANGITVRGSGLIEAKRVDAP